MWLPLYIYWKELVYNATLILNVGYINVLGQYAHLSKLIYLNSSQIFFERAWNRGDKFSFVGCGNGGPGRCDLNSERCFLWVPKKHFMLTSWMGQKKGPNIQKRPNAARDDEGWPLSRCPSSAPSICPSTDPGWPLNLVLSSAPTRLFQNTKPNKLTHSKK